MVNSLLDTLQKAINIARVNLKALSIATMIAVLVVLLGVLGLLGILVIYGGEELHFLNLQNLNSSQISLIAIFAVIIGALYHALMSTFIVDILLFKKFAGLTPQKIAANFISTNFAKLFCGIIIRDTSILVMQTSSITMPLSLIGLVLFIFYENSIIIRNSSIAGAFIESIHKVKKLLFPSSLLILGTYLYTYAAAYILSVYRTLFVVFFFCIVLVVLNILFKIAVFILYTENS